MGARNDIPAQVIYIVGFKFKLHLKQWLTASNEVHESRDFKSVRNSILTRVSHSLWMKAIQTRWEDFPAAKVLELLFLWPKQALLNGKAEASLNNLCYRQAKMFKLNSKCSAQLCGLWAEPLIPKDTPPARSRARALGEWCTANGNPLNKHATCASDCSEVVQKLCKPSPKTASSQ